LQKVIAQILMSFVNFLTTLQATYCKFWATFFVVIQTQNISNIKTSVSLSVPVLCQLILSNILNKTTKHGFPCHSNCSWLD